MWDIALICNIPQIQYLFQQCRYLNKEGEIDA